MDPLLAFPQSEVKRMFKELGELRVELDDDPLVYGPKRLNAKTAQVRRMLDRCEKLFLDVSQKLQAVRRELRIATTDLDLGKKDLFANDPETRAGRSVSDREAIAAGKLEQEIRQVHELNLTSEDLDAVLVVIKAKRVDLKDTEGRLRDQIRLCSEEIGLGGRWGSQVPHAPEISGRPAYITATGADVDEVTAMMGTIEGEIALLREAGEWQEPVDLSVKSEEPDAPLENLPPVVLSEVPTAVKTFNVADLLNAITPPDVVTNPVVTPTVEPIVVPETKTTETSDKIELDDTPSIPKDLETIMAGTVPSDEVNLFLDEVTISAALMPKPDMATLVGDIDMDAILDMFESA